MAGSATPPDGVDACVERLADRLVRTERTIGVVESLTGGLLVQALARAKGSSDWLRGGVVAYSREVKHDVVGVRAASVVSEQAASEMAAGACSVLGADVGLAVTGAGGPDAQDGQPPGTVFIAVAVDGVSAVHRLQLDGEPADVCTQTVEQAIIACSTALEGVRSC